MTRACADDVAAALRDRAHLTVYEHIFEMSRRATGLSHNLRKCVIVPLGFKFTIQNAHLLRDWLQANVPAWGSFHIEEMAKILSICLGPAVLEKSMDAPIDKWKCRARLIAKHGMAPSVQNTRRERRF